MIWYHFFSVPPEISTLDNVTVLEGGKTTFTCISEGDPAPSMTFRKVGNTYDYNLGENVS